LVGLRLVLLRADPGLDSLDRDLDFLSVLSGDDERADRSAFWLSTRSSSGDFFFLNKFWRTIRRDGGSEFLRHGVSVMLSKRRESTYLELGSLAEFFGGGWNRSGLAEPRPSYSRIFRHKNLMKTSWNTTAERATVSISRQQQWQWQWQRRRGLLVWNARD
jgi:hypothetical protein